MIDCAERLLYVGFAKLEEMFKERNELKSALCLYTICKKFTSVFWAAMRV